MITLHKHTKYKIMNSEIEDIKSQFETLDIVDETEVVAEEEVPKHHTGHGAAINWQALRTSSIDMVKEMSYTLANEMLRDERVETDEEKITCYISTNSDKGQYEIYLLTSKKDKHKNLQP